MHEAEQPRGVVLYLDIDVELYVAVLGLTNHMSFDVGSTGVMLTFIRSSIV